MKIMLTPRELVLLACVALLLGSTIYCALAAGREAEASQFWFNQWKEAIHK